MAKGPYVVCQKHGTDLIKGVGNHARMIRTAQPKTKKQRYLSGCPVCKKEQQGS